MSSQYQHLSHATDFSCQSTQETEAGDAHTAQLNTQNDQGTSLVPMGTTPRARYCYEVPVSCIPVKYRDRLPRRSRICYVEEPEQHNCHPEYFTTRAAITTQALVKAKQIMITAVEADAIRRAIATPAASTITIKAAPAYFLPYDLQGLSSDPSFDLSESDALMVPPTQATQIDEQTDQQVTGLALPATGTTQQEGESRALFDVWYISPTENRDEELQMVHTSCFSERLANKMTGPVYTVWMRAEYIDQSLPWSSDLQHLDSHQRRLQVHQHALQVGAVAPFVMVDEPPLKEQETHDEFTPLKDIFLQKEDLDPVLDDAEIRSTAPDQSQILRTTIRIVKQHVKKHQARGELERATACTQIEESLRKMLQWHRHQRNKPTIARLEPVFSTHRTVYLNQPASKLPARRVACVHIIRRLIGYRVVIDIPPHLASLPGRLQRSREEKPSFPARMNDQNRKEMIA